MVVILASDGPLYAIAFLYHLERDDATSEQLVARVPRGHRKVDSCAKDFRPRRVPYPLRRAPPTVRDSRHFICAVHATRLILPRPSGV